MSFSTTALCGMTTSPLSRSSFSSFVGTHLTAAAMDDDDIIEERRRISTKPYNRRLNDPNPPDESPNVPITFHISHSPRPSLTSPLLPLPLPLLHPSTMRITTMTANRGRSSVDAIATNDDSSRRHHHGVDSPLTPPSSFPSAFVSSSISHIIVSISIPTSSPTRFDNNDDIESRDVDRRTSRRTRSRAVACE